MRNYLRQRIAGESAHVDFAELFFDLVFVFAITQLSHTLLAHLTWQGALQTAVLLFAVWWVWIYTTWATNFLDPTQPVIRVMLFVLMFVGLILSTSLPEAFGDRGLTFALAYVAMQVGRCLFTAWAMREAAPENARNFLRITSWQALGGVFWILGGLLPPEQRLICWIIAVLIEGSSSKFAFWTPWLGRTGMDQLDVEGGHMAERAGLFIIIALGESILVSGATFGETPLSALSIVTFIIAFAGSVAMWWIYFNNSVEPHHSAAPVTGKRTMDLARDGYTYFHIIIVAGIIVMAVGDELMLAHPTGHHADWSVILTIVGGPLIYLAGIFLFQGIVRQRWPLPTTIAMLALAALIVVGGNFEALHLAAATTLILVILGTIETLMARRTVQHAH